MDYKTIAKLASGFLKVMANEGQLQVVIKLIQNFADTYYNLKFEPGAKPVPPQVSMKIDDLLSTLFNLVKETKINPTNILEYTRDLYKVIMENAQHFTDQHHTILMGKVRQLLSAISKL